MGGSYGGFMTSWIISHNPNAFKSAIVERALLNWETMVGTSDIGIGFPEMYLLDDMSKKYKSIQKKESYDICFKYKNTDINSSLSRRLQVSNRASGATVSNLKKRGVETAMLRFPGESHELSRSGTPVHRKQRFDHIIRWHKKHLA